MKILIVDANPWHLHLLKKLVFRFKAGQVETKSSLRAALDWCAGNTPDLVLADCALPGREGLSLVEALRSREDLVGIPILAVTPADMSVRRKALAAGASDVIAEPIDPLELYARLGTLLALRDSRKRLEEALAADRLVMHFSRLTDLRDHETATHIGHMARYARLIAAKMGWNEDGQNSILLAAPMHDIGKVAIPDHILTKPGRLSEGEYTVMQNHAFMGYEILKGNGQPIIELASEIALTHHERVDGSGYPHGLRGDEIPLGARMVAVADVFDALTTARPYKEAWPFERAVIFLNENKGSHFDPACVDAFLSDAGEIRNIRRGFAGQAPA